MLFQQVFAEAGGKLSGHIDNASDGLTLQTDGSGKTWAWYGPANQWALVYKLKEGDTLWSLAGKLYGVSQRWTEIRDFPPNKPIVGTKGDAAFGGDTILVPNLPAPFPKPGAEVPGLPPPPPPAPTKAPASWPAGVPYPGEPAAPAPIVPVAYKPPTGAAPAAGAGAGAAAGAAPAGEPFWTTGRIAVAATAGAVGVGLIVYFATRKRRNPRRRRNG